MKTRYKATNTIVISNDLVEAYYNLTPVEQKLIYTFISVIRSEKGNFEIVDPKKKYTLHVDEYADIMCIAPETAYQGMLNALESLYKSEIHIKTGGQMVRISWVSAIEYDPDERTLALCWSPDIIPFISELTGQFTTMKLGTVAKFRSFNSMRLYGLLKKDKFKGDKARRWVTEVTVAEFKNILNLKEAYAFKHLKSNVIKRAVAEINRTCQEELTVETQYIQPGRKVTKVNFEVKWNESVP